MIRPSHGTICHHGLEPAVASASTFLGQGALLLRGVIPTARVAAMHSAFLERHRSYLVDLAHEDALKVGDRRFMVTVDLEPPFADAEVFAPAAVHPLMLALLALLSPSCVMGSFGGVVSLPSAADQHLHRDFSEELFPWTPLEPMLPPYAVTMVVPLIDVDETTGTTAVWAGSHRQRLRQEDYPPDEARWARMSVGDVLLMDYRLVHAGTANHSLAPRPILYVVYCRPWFRDHINYGIQQRLRVPHTSWPLIPERYRALLLHAG